MKLGVKMQKVKFSEGKICPPSFQGAGPQSTGISSQDKTKELDVILQPFN